MQEKYNGILEKKKKSTRFDVFFKHETIPPFSVFRFLHEKKKSQNLIALQNETFSFPRGWAANFHWKIIIIITSIYFDHGNLKSK